MKPPSIVKPFHPTEDQIRKTLPKGLSFGVRTISLFKADGEEQYIVYKPGYDAASDPTASHVLGSGFSFERAMISAERALDLDRIQPKAFSSRFEGCTFTKLVEPGNVALQHVLMSSDGKELGRADTREQAAKNALHRALIGARDVSFEEFCAIAVAVHVVRESRKNTYGATFAHSSDMDKVHAMIAKMYAASESVRQGAQAVARASSKEYPDPLRALRAVTVGQILQSLGDCEGVNYRLTTEGGQWEGYVVLHTSAMTPMDALRQAYRDYLEAEVADQNGPPSSPQKERVM
jgi:hypothetical protein